MLNNEWYVAACWINDSDKVVSKAGGKTIKEAIDSLLADTLETNTKTRVGVHGRDGDEILWAWGSSLASAAREAKTMAAKSAVGNGR